MDASTIISTIILLVVIAVVIWLILWAGKTQAKAAGPSVGSVPEPAPVTKGQGLGDLPHLPVPQAPDLVAAPPCDDLEIIEGIGPKIAGVLNQAGVTSFNQLAGMEPARISEILKEANLRLADPASWPEQARLAAAGDLAGLQALQEALKGGRAN